jgi:hypothetical protein
VTSLTTDDPGDGYLGWYWYDAVCLSWLNGLPIVLNRTGNECGFTHTACLGLVDGIGHGCRQSVISVGYGTPLSVRITRVGGSDEASQHAVVVDLMQDTRPDDCSVDGFTATAVAGSWLVDVTATVEPGGEYDPNAISLAEQACSECCRGTDDIPDEITAAFVSLHESMDAYEGDWVFVRSTAAFPCRTRWIFYGLDPTYGDPYVSIERPPIDGQRQPICKNCKCHIGFGQYDVTSYALSLAHGPSVAATTAYAAAYAAAMGEVADPDRAAALATIASQRAYCDEATWIDRPVCRPPEGATVEVYTYIPTGDSAGSWVHTGTLTF